MQLAGTGYTDPLMPGPRSPVRGVDNLHSLRMNGTIELPIGPNKLLFANTSGWVARAIERWQTSFILNMATGQPSSIGGAEQRGMAIHAMSWRAHSGKSRKGKPSGMGLAETPERFTEQIRDPARPPVRQHRIGRRITVCDSAPSTRWP